MDEEQEQDQGQETSEPSEPADQTGDEKNQGPDQSHDKKGPENRSSSIRVGLLKGKVLVLAGAMVLLVAGIGMVKGHPRVREWIDSHMNERVIEGERFRFTEEDIPPFFIPVAGKGSNGVIRVSFSAVWDTMASVQFERKQREIRNQVYQRLKGLEAEKGNLEQEIPLIEQEIQDMLRKLIGRLDLDIRVKDIKSY